MSTDSQSHLPTSSGMSAEAGFDGNEIQAPVRVSGFISLLLGVCSVTSFLAIGVLIIPFLAIGFGVFALRRYGDPRPAGVRAACWGLLLAVGFGSFGLGVPLFKRNTLGPQAEHFAREFVKLVSTGEIYYAMELKKAPANRFIRTMPLEEHYQDNEASEQVLEEFRDGGLRKMLVEMGPDAEWELDRPVRVFHHYGRDHVDIVLANYDKETPRLIRIELEKFDSKDGDIQWYISNFMHYRERIVAESIL